jgi:hypothetical protein
MISKGISMAFQKKHSFFSFLQGKASGSTLEEVAPAENYILDERLPDAREDEFFNFNGFSNVAYSNDSWFKQHTDYTMSHVAQPVTSGTFASINRDNWIRGISPDWDVVRLETISGMRNRAKGLDVDESEAAELIEEMLLARKSGDILDPLREARLEKWIQRVNGGADRRPAFVAPFAEVESILAQPDWANRLRDSLGLGHIRPCGGNPMAVVLMQYNLVRVHNAHIGKPGWAATPTVLDDVSGQMPNPCFFPAPKKASSDGYGYTVDLAITDATYRREFLHGHISYELADIRNIGFVTEEVSSARIAEARKGHCELLKDELVHFKDLPARP